MCEGSPIAALKVLSQVSHLKADAVGGDAGSLFLAPLSLFSP